MAEPVYVTDPELLKQLEAPAQAAPPAAPAAEAPARQYISDPATLAALDGTKAPLPEAPWGNAPHAGFTKALNTATLGGYRNAEAAASYLLGKMGVEGFPNDTFENHFQKWKAYEEGVAKENPKSALAGTAAGVAGLAYGAPFVLPEAGMATLYSGGAGALARSATLGSMTAYTGELLDSHDARKAGAAGIAGLVAGPIADKAVNLAKPFYRAAQPLTKREIEVSNVGGPIGTPSGWWSKAGDILAQGAAGTMGGMVGSTVGKTVLPSDYAGELGAAAGAVGGRQIVSGYQQNRDALTNQGLYYQKGNRGAIAVGAAIPQVITGLLGP